MTLNLHDLDTPLEPVRFVKDGPEYAFHPIDGIGQQLLISTTGAEPEVRRKALYDIVAGCIPEAPRDLIDRLTYDKVDLLLALAGKAVKSVEEWMDLYAGKAEATGEVSASATPSPIPSPGSPRRSASGQKRSGAVPTG
jgi:hypothetical protein